MLGFSGDGGGGGPAATHLALMASVFVRWPPHGTLGIASSRGPAKQLHCNGGGGGGDDGAAGGKAMSTISPAAVFA